VSARALSATVIVPTITPSRVERLLRSLARVEGEFETIVVDNGTGDPSLQETVGSLSGARLIRLERNHGYSRATNLAAREAEGDALILLNDDVVVDSDYVSRMATGLDPGSGVVMAAGVMRDAARPGLIETAGIDLDRTLLPFDYLNGEPLSVLEGPVCDPVGPSGVAAAIARDVFLELGGFDERIFAYMEDVDLALRLRLAGGRCRLVRAQGAHEHSATLGSGSARKNYLMGYGRGYLLRKWRVLTPARVPAVTARELAICAGQAAFDRNLAGVRGRVQGLRAGGARRAYPGDALGAEPPSLASSLLRRWRRRVRMRRARA
jgi:GT2 family glycosyltransferase